MSSNQYVAQCIASMYADNVGKQWSPCQPGHDARLNRSVADWYMRQSSTNDLATLTAYHVLSGWLDQQFAALSMYFDVRFTTDDPYKDAYELFDSLDQGVLRVFKSTDDDHPLWTSEQNDRFRTVHDVLGHYASGVTFDRNGEDAAYRSHAKTFPDVALSALATETRGQNSALVYGPRPGEFAPQYATLAPRWVWQPGT